jgi:hypothetical protein
MHCSHPRRKTGAPFARVSKFSTIRANCNEMKGGWKTMWDRYENRCAIMRVKSKSRDSDARSSKIGIKLSWIEAIPNPVR